MWKFCKKFKKKLTAWEELVMKVVNNEITYSHKDKYKIDFKDGNNNYTVWIENEGYPSFGCLYQCNGECIPEPIRTIFYVRRGVQKQLKNYLRKNPHLTKVQDREFIEKHGLQKFLKTK